MLETCKVILTFESVDETIWCNHLLYIILNENITRKDGWMILLFLFISGLNLFLSVVSLWTLYYYWHLDFLEW